MPCQERVKFYLRVFTRSKKLVKNKDNFDLLGMATEKKIRDFNNLDKYPDLKKALVPSIKTLPFGSMNTKVIINNGEVVERVYKTPNGQVITLFPTSISEEAA